MQSPKGDEKQGCTRGNGTVINTPPLVSGVLISDVTDKILVQIEEWQNRPLDDVYPVIYIDAIHYSVRDNAVIIKKAAYGHLEKLAFCDFFEIATSCNSLDYRELQHRIFKVTSKNCSF